MISQNPYQQSIADDELIVDEVVLIHQEGSLFVLSLSSLGNETRNGFTTPHTVQGESPKNESGTSESGREKGGSKNGVVGDRMESRGG